MGTERYSWELLNGMQRIGAEAFGIGSNPSRKRFSLAINAISKLPALATASLGRARLLHATDPSSAIALPALGVATVATIHDLMPLILRDAHYGEADRLFSTLCYGTSARCDAIIAVSNQTGREVAHYLKVPSHKVRVIHHGVSEDFRVLSIKRDKFVGYVGDINPRKRIDLLIEAFAMVRSRHEDCRLLIVGKNIAQYLDSESERIRRMVKSLGLENSVIFTGHVSEEELVRLYNVMKVLVLPSDYEGFGFPIIEAERCGTPVVVRKGTRISEEVSECALKAGSVKELAEQISLMLSESKFSEEVSAAGMRHSAEFTWERCVAETDALYRSLLEH